MGYRVGRREWHGLRTTSDGAVAVRTLRAVCRLLAAASPLFEPHTGHGWEQSVKTEGAKELLSVRGRENLVDGRGGTDSRTGTTESGSFHRSRGLFMSDRTLATGRNGVVVADTAGWGGSGRTRVVSEVPRR